MFWLGILRRSQKDSLITSSVKLLSTASRSRVVTLPPPPKKKSQWWVVDGEMHEVGDDVPLRERFHIPRENLPNRRRKLLRAQFMKKTRLVLKETEAESWCKQYTELFQELRDNWERLYWDEGFSRKVAQERARYDSEEDDDADFSPNRRRSFSAEPMREPFSSEQMKARGTGYSQPISNQGRMGFLRDKLEYDRERNLRERAFAPMDSGRSFNPRQGFSKDEPGRSFDTRQGYSRDEPRRNFNPHQGNFRDEPLNPKRFFS